MNLKVARTMLILCIIYIVGFYILKFAFPQYLLLTITDPTILKFGEFLGSSKWYLYTAQTITTFLTFYLFVCASRGSFKLKWYELLYIIMASIGCKLVSIYAIDYYVHISTACMFLLAAICKGKLLYASVSFVIHGLLSQFLFTIRGFETVISRINYASGLVLSIEGWVWLVLLVLVFYLKEKKNGRLVTTISQQNG